MPSFAPLPTPTMIAVGVARPSAHGQAITSIPTNEVSANESAFEKPNAGRPKYIHNPNEMIAMTNTVGTNTEEILSASACIGALLPCASSTIFIM